MCVNFIQDRKQLVVPGAGRDKMGEWVPNGCGRSLWGDKDVLELVGGDGECTKCHRLESLRQLIFCDVTFAFIIF
jgi:hypothetical protein